MAPSAVRAIGRRTSCVAVLQRRVLRPARPIRRGTRHPRALGDVRRLSTLSASTAATVAGKAFCASISVRLLLLTLRCPLWTNDGTILKREHYAIEPSERKADKP